MPALDLYLIRHGLAGQRSDDPSDAQRPLTDEGKRRTRQVAKRLVELEISVDMILTSPLTRAHQTATLLHDAGLSKALEVVGYLAPDGKIEDWLSWLQNWRSSHQSLALVGHEPDLSAWAEQLIYGAAHDKIVLKKAGVIGLTLPEAEDPIGHSQLFWLTPPRLLLEP
jgi:phosphohistidine phosphatase